MTLGNVDCGGSASGRYVSSDPLSVAAEMNTSVYAANDPINHIDPSRLLLFAFDGTNNTDVSAELLDDQSFSNVSQFRDSYRGDSSELNIHQNGNGPRPPIKARSLASVSLLQLAGGLATTVRPGAAYLLSLVATPPAQFLSH